MEWNGALECGRWGTKDGERNARGVQPNNNLAGLPTEEGVAPLAEQTGQTSAGFSPRLPTAGDCRNSTRSPDARPGQLERSLVLGDVIVPSFFLSAASFPKSVEPSAGFFSSLFRLGRRKIFQNCFQWRQQSLIGPEFSLAPGDVISARADGASRSRPRFVFLNLNCDDNHDSLRTEEWPRDIFDSFCRRFSFSLSLSLSLSLSSARFVTVRPWRNRCSDPHIYDGPQLFLLFHFQPSFLFFFGSEQGFTEFYSVSSRELESDFLLPGLLGFEWKTFFFNQFNAFEIVKILALSIWDKLVMGFTVFYRVLFYISRSTLSWEEFLRRALPSLSRW